MIDQLFGIRHWDKGVCERCATTRSGIYGPAHHEKFYCRDCWPTFLRGLAPADWTKWQRWAPQKRTCIAESAFEHDVKCVLLGLSRTGGTVYFPSTFSSSIESKIREFCDHEPELSSVHVSSFGSGDEQFVRASTAGLPDGITEARAFLIDCQVPDNLQSFLSHVLGRSLSSLPIEGLLELQGEVFSAQQRIAQEIEKRFAAPRQTVKSGPRHQPSGVWQSQVDDGTFEDFESDATADIEKHVTCYPDGVPVPLVVTNRGRTVSLDFAEMEAEDVEKSVRWPIRCADAMMLQEPTWTSQSGLAELVTVEPSSYDHVKVLNIMFRQDGDSLQDSFKLVSVKRVQNIFLMRKFEAERQNLIAQRGEAGVAEQSLFHGTRCHNPLGIVQGREGFMLDYAKDGFYGHALYFAENARYSHAYAHRIPSPEGEQFQMLICRVLCGNSRHMGTATDRSMTRLKLPPSDYDSVRGGPHTSSTGSSMMCVVYQDAQVYPDYVVTYSLKRQEKCSPVTPLALQSLRAEGHDESSESDKSSKVVHARWTPRRRERFQHHVRRIRIGVGAPVATVWPRRSRRVSLSMMSGRQRNNRDRKSVV